MNYIYAELRDIWRENYQYSDYIEGYLNNVFESDISNNAIYDDHQLVKIENDE